MLFALLLVVSPAHAFVVRQKTILVQRNIIFRAENLNLIENPSDGPFTAPIRNPPAQPRVKLVSTAVDADEADPPVLDWFDTTRRSRSEVVSNDPPVLEPAPKNPLPADDMGPVQKLFEKIMADESTPQIPEPDKGRVQQLYEKLISPPEEASGDPDMLGQRKDPSSSAAKPTPAPTFPASANPYAELTPETFAPKADAKKEETKRADPLKVDPPKKEEPKKVDTPTKDEPKKVDTPKKDEPKKVDTPRKDEPRKVDPPKKEEAPKEVMKVEPKKEAPKVDPPKVEPPKAGPPKAEPSKSDSPKAEPLKADTPKAAPSPTGQQKVETPKPEPPKAEKPKAPSTQEPPKSNQVVKPVPQIQAAPPKKNGLSKVGPLAGLPFLALVGAGIVFRQREALLEDLNSDYDNKAADRRKELTVQSNLAIALLGGAFLSFVGLFALALQ